MSNFSEFHQDYEYACFILFGESWIFANFVASQPAVISTTNCCNTSHKIKRTGKMIKINRINAFTGLKFDKEGAKIEYFCKLGQNCVLRKVRGSQNVLCQKSIERF